MKTVSVMSLPENSYISAPVFLDEKYILLSPDIPVTSELKKRLLDWGFSQVQTDGIPKDSPSLDETVAETPSESAIPILEKDVKEQEQREQATVFFKSLMSFYDAYIEKFKTKNELRLDEPTEKIKSILSMLKSHRRFLLSVQNPEDMAEKYMTSHVIRTTIIALALSEFLKLPPHKQIDLGLACLFHEIGMIRIPESIYMSDKPLSDRERQAITAHPILGFKMLKEANFPAPIYLAILEHHENINGTGYPRKITGDKISPYGKILSVACAYEAATSKRPYREGQDGHSGIMDMLKDMNKRYDDKVLRALVFTLSIYPIGTFVLLSNNAKGYVVKTDSENPKYPTVKLIVNEKDVPYIEQPLLQTREGDPIQIVRPLNKEEADELKKKLR
jgi:HD-GYP domain-containing protein (c-di-GMP phosphodiesterase class II)